MFHLLINFRTDHFSSSVFLSVFYVSESERRGSENKKYSDIFQCLVQLSLNEHYLPVFFPCMYARRLFMCHAELRFFSNGKFTMQLPFFMALLISYFCLIFALRFVGWSCCCYSVCCFFLLLLSCLRHTTSSFFKQPKQNAQFTICFANMS